MRRGFRSICKAKPGARQQSCGVVHRAASIFRHPACLRRMSLGRVAGFAVLGLAIATLPLTPRALQAQSFNTLYSFVGANGTCASGAGADGAHPSGSGVIADASGNLYGTASCGGTYDQGNVFELVKSSTGYTEQILYNFGAFSGDGFQPQSTPVMDSAGNLFGTTFYGGTAGVGAVYELIKSSSGYTEQILHSFAFGGDALDPYTGANLIIDSSGNLYGTAMGGGANSTGAVFELTKTSSGYSEQVIYSFSPRGTGGVNVDGYQPMGGLLMDSAGNLYGTTEYGGANGNGTVYELTPSSTGYSETTLYSFGAAGTGDGTFSEASLIMDAQGNLYGTTVQGGANNTGTVFELVKNSTGYTEQLIYSFSAVTFINNTTEVNNDGADPRAGLVMDNSGNLYGTAFIGGTNGIGTVFELVKSSSGYTETTIHDFSVMNATTNINYDGAYPQDSLYLDSSGNLFGTAENGGTTGAGTVFEILPQILVPNVVGLVQATAESDITGAGLTVGTVTQQSSATVPSGDVISESPAAGTLVAAGSAVGLVVSTGSGTQLQPTTLTISFNPATAAAGSADTATATITSAASSVTGTVNFAASSSNTVTTLCAQSAVASVSGTWQATCTFTESATGTYAITATYSGDASNQGSASTATLTVNPANAPVLQTVANSTTALAINANNAPGLAFNAVLNNDSSVSILLSGTLISGQGCPAYSTLSANGGLSNGAIYVDSANNLVYLAMYSASAGLYATYESISSTGTCTQGPLLQLGAVTSTPQMMELNADTVQGNVYLAVAYGGAFPDELYITPIAPWSASALPAPVQLPLDYSAQYGQLEVDASNHQVYLNELGSSITGPTGIYATSGFFVYDPNQSATPASNLQHVVGYVSGTTTTPFNVATLLDNGAGKLVLVNANPNASSATLATPITILDTTQFSFFTNTQPGTASGTVNITPGSGLSTIAATTAYDAISTADIDTVHNTIYAYAFNTTSQPGELLAYNLTAGANSPETVLSSNMPLPATYGPPVSWNQLNYDPQSTEIALSVAQLGSGALGVTSPLCAGSPVLTQLVGNQGFPTPIDLPVVNNVSGYIYAIQPGTGISAVAPPATGCSTPAPIQISPATLPAGAVGSAYSQTLTASGGSGTGYTWSVQSGTALSATGLTLSPAGVISGIPTQAETAAPVTLQVTDSAGNTGTQSDQLTVYPALGIVGAPPNGALGVLYSYTFTGTGGSGSGYTFSVTAGATSLSALGLSLSSSGTLSGTPPATGSASFTLQVTDSAGDTAVRPYTVVVTSAILIAPASLPAGTVGAAYSATLTATGGSGSGYVWSVSVGAASLSALGLSLSSAGVLSGTPSAAGQATFTAQVTDSFGGTATQSYTVVINAAVSGPAVANDNETITVNDSGTSVEVIDVNDPTETIHVSDTAIVSVATPTSIQLTGPVLPVPYGQNFTLTANVVASIGNAVPTSGSVIFTWNGATISVVPVNASGTAVLTTGVVLPVGFNEIDVAYSGSGAFLPSQTVGFPVQIIQASTTTQLTLNAAPAGYNSTFTATVVPATSGTPTGTVTFYDGSTVMGTGTLSATGVATYATNSLPGGMDSVTATYTGDTDYKGSTSNAVAAQVASFGITFKGGGGTLAPGGSTSFTVTVTPANGPYDKPVTLGVKGLPPGATSNFSSTTLTPGSQPVSATLTITAPPLSAQLFRKSRMGFAFALLLPLLLPLSGRKRRRLWSGLLLIVACAGLLTALNGCGTSSGFFLQPPQTFTVTVTAASGADLQSATLNITVQ